MIKFREKSSYRKDLFKFISIQTSSWYVPNIPLRGMFPKKGNYQPPLCALYLYTGQESDEYNLVYHYLSIIILYMHTTLNMQNIPPTYFESITL